MHSIISLVTSSQFRIYLWGESFTKAQARTESSQSLQLLWTLLLHIPLTIPHLSIKFVILLLQIKSNCGTIDFGHPSSKILHFALINVHESVSLSQVDVVCSSSKFCLSAKMHRTPLNKHEISSTFPFQLIHSDVWCHEPIASLLGFRYYVILICRSFY